MQLQVEVGERCRTKTCGQTVRSGLPICGAASVRVPSIDNDVSLVVSSPDQRQTFHICRADIAGRTARASRRLDVVDGSLPPLRIVASERDTREDATTPVERAVAYPSAGA